METVRLTVGQAVVRFWPPSTSSATVIAHRFIAGFWGIFGHGNVAGLGQALEELGDAAAGCPSTGPRTSRPRSTSRRPSPSSATGSRTYACISSVGPGALNMITGAAAATVNRIPVLLFPSDYFANRAPDPGAPAGRAPDRARRQRQRRVPAGLALLRPDLPAGAAAGSSLPAAFRVLTDPVDTGAVTISLPEDVQAEAFDWPLSVLRAPRLADPPAGCPRPADVADAVAPDRGGHGRRSSSPAAARSTPRRPTSWPPSPPRFGIPVVETQAGKGALPWDHPMNIGPAGTNGGLAANRLVREADLVLCVGHPDGRLRDRLADDVPEPRRSRFVGAQRRARWTPTRCGPCRSSADAREALRALEAALGAAGYAGHLERRYRRAGRRAQGRVGRDRHPPPRGRRRSRATLGQSEVIGVVNDVVGGQATVICAAGSLPGDLLRLWRVDGSQGLPRRVRLLVHGLRDRRRPRRPPRRPRPRGRGHGRRRVVPDAQLGDRDRGGRGPEADDRGPRQPRLPVHPRPAALGRGARLRQRAALPRSGQRTA